MSKTDERLEKQLPAGILLFSCCTKWLILFNWTFYFKIKMCNDINRLDKNVLYFSPLNARVGTKVLR